MKRFNKSKLKYIRTDNKIYTDLRRNIYGPSKNKSEDFETSLRTIFHKKRHGTYYVNKTSVHSVPRKFYQV